MNLTFISIYNSAVKISSSLITARKMNLTCIRIYNSSYASSQDVFIANRRWIQIHEQLKLLLGRWTRVANITATKTNLTCISIYSSCYASSQEFFLSVAGFPMVICHICVMHAGYCSERTLMDENAKKDKKIMNAVKAMRLVLGQKAPFTVTWMKTTDCR